MNPLKEAIFVEVRKIHLELSTLSNNELNNLLFYNPSMLRLSLKGFIVIKGIFTTYSFELPTTLKSRHWKNLSTLTYPYFFTKKRLILFSGSDATMITICGGIESFLDDRF